MGSKPTLSRRRRSTRCWAALAGDIGISIAALGCCVERTFRQTCEASALPLAAVGSAIAEPLCGVMQAGIRIAHVMELTHDGIASTADLADRSRPYFIANLIADHGWALHAKSVIRFADLAAGQAVLQERDRFVQALSPFDRQSRLKTDRDVTEQEYLRHVAAQVRAWEPAEQEKIVRVVEKIRGQLSPWKLPLPATILLIKTTGEEEGHAAYTRGAAIILPQRVVDRSAESLQPLLTHELFHVLSRHDAKLRDKLYAIVGFTPAGSIDWPDALKKKAITNPDAPVVEHVIRFDQLDRDDLRTPVHAAPVLFSSTDRYDRRRGGEFFDYLTFRLLILHRHGDRWRPLLSDGQPILLDPAKTPQFHDQIGRNTTYILHPEEILADNFVLLVSNRESVKSPRVLAEMKNVLTAK